MVDIQGNCDRRFEAVADAFAENFAERDEVGAAVSVAVDGTTVVDLWGGRADGADRPWEKDTMALVFSTTKGLTTMCALLLADRGELDVDASVSKYWPEFAAAGKGDVTVAQLMSHQAGLPAFDQPVTGDDCNDDVAIAAVLAGQTPRWEPGTAHGYHAVTFGWLVGEVVRRISGRSVGRFLADELTGPLDLDVHLGLDPAEQHRVSELLPFRLDRIGPGDVDDALVQAVLDPASLTFQVLSNPPIDPALFNTPAVHAAEWPAANGIATARGLASLYGELACDRLLSSSILDDASAPRVDGPDRVLLQQSSFGLGFMLPCEVVQYGPAGGFGHGGAGGSLAFADRENRVGFGYVMNQMSARLGTDPRAAALVQAAYASLD